MQAAARQVLQEPSLHPNPTLTHVTKPGGRRGVADETLTDPNLETGLTGNRLACATASETVAARSPPGDTLLKSAPLRVKAAKARPDVDPEQSC